MPGPITSSTPQVSQTSCAGDLIPALRSFELGCILARVPAGKTLILSGVLLGVSTVTVERVLEGDCGVNYYLPMETAANCPLALSSATPMQPIKVQGLYRLCISPANLTALIKEELIESDSAACCSITARCQPGGIPLPPVTALVTGIPCPLVAPFVWQGALYTSLADFIIAVQLQVAGAVYNPVLCSFTAPAGSVFPALVLSLPVSAVIYCPTQHLLDGGFGYHINDPKDPAATVELSPCLGDLTTDSIWLYPTAATGHTVRVLDCAGATIGYGANQSKCAAPCPCVSSCGTAAITATPAPSTARIGWANTLTLPATYSTAAAGTEAVTPYVLGIRDLVLRFSLLNAPPAPNLTVRLGTDTIGGALAYDPATGLGTYTFSFSSRFYTPGAARIELVKGNVLLGALSLVYVNANPSQSYGDTQWIAYSAV